MARTLFAAAAVLLGAATAGAAPRPAHNGLIVFASARGQDRGGEIYVVGGRGGASRNLSRNQASDTVPVVSPSGTRILFVSNRPGYSAVYVERIDGEGLRRLTDSSIHIEPPPLYAQGLVWQTGEQAVAVQAQNGLYVVGTADGQLTKVSDAAPSGSDPSWSADGERLAYTRLGTYPDPAAVTVVRRDGSPLWSRVGHDPHWSPQGSAIAYAVSTPGLPYSSLVVADGDGKTLATFPDSTFEGWSPDGKWLAIMHTTTSPTYEANVAVVRVGEWAPSAIGPGSNVSWSPDSTLLAMTLPVPPDYHSSVVVADPGSGEQTPVADNASVLGWSADGNRLAMADGTSQFADAGHHIDCGTVLTIRPDGSDLRRAVLPPPTTANSWGGWADGGAIVYEREAGTALFTIRADGTGLKRLASDGGCGDSSPAWSPDGSRIAFARETYPHGSRSLYVRSAKGPHATSIGPGCCTDSRDPAWFPDGKSVAFTYGFHTIDVVRLAGTEPSTLLGGADDPSWAPNGRDFAYVYRYGGIRVAAVGAPAHGPDIAAGSEPAWSPNGRWIAYTTRDGIRKVHPDGTGDDAVLSGPQDEIASPAWSPDGKWIVYTRRGDLWVSRPDGSNRRRLTSGPAFDASPSWQRALG